MDIESIMCGICIGLTIGLLITRHNIEDNDKIIKDKIIEENTKFLTKDLFENNKLICINKFYFMDDGKNIKQIFEQNGNQIKCEVK